MQIPLALNPPRRPGFGNFLAGPNQAVVDTLKFGLEAGACYFLGGPPGYGRTHLALASYAHLARAGRSVRFVPLGHPGAFRVLDEAAAEWLVLDDVDRLAGQDDAELGLFNALNRWRADLSGVLMTGVGRRGFRLPDLNSRLAQATGLVLRPLDDSDRHQLISMLAREREVAIGRGVADYLLQRGPRNPGELARLIEAMTARALAERRVLSIPLARELLGRSPTRAE